MPDELGEQSAKPVLGFVESIFRLYHRDLHRFLLRRLRSGESADDVAQEVYLRLLRIEHAELVRRPQAYMYQIAFNVVSEMRLRHLNEPVMFDSDTADYVAEHPQDTGDNGADELEFVLSQLTPTFRAVLLLRKRDGLSHAEIAQRLGLSLHTVKRYVIRAAAQCRSVVWTR